MRVHTADRRTEGQFLTPAQNPGVSITSKLVEDRFLSPSLDGQVLNRLQYDESPEIDSFVEVGLGAALRLPESAEKDTILAVFHGIKDANVLEGSLLRQMSGAADDLATRLRGSNENTLRLSSMSIVRKLKGPLMVLYADGTPAERTEALVVIRSVLGQVTRDQLFCETVERELGKKRMSVLTGLVNS